MKSLTRIILSLFIFAALAISCKKPVPLQVKHIPKNATVVAVINAKAIQKKLLASQGAIENMLKSTAGTDTSAAKGKQEWEDLLQSGLDLSSNFYLSVSQKGGALGTGTGSMVIAAIGSLTSEDKLEKYLKKKMPEREVKKEKNYSYTTFEGDNMVAWSKDLVIAMSYQQPGSRQMEYDSATGEYNFKSPVKADGDLKMEMDSYFTMKEDQSVAGIAEFRDLMQNSADASLWVNSAGSMENIPLPRVKELFANSYTAATLNFEDGKIVVDGKSYLSKQLKDLVEKYKDAEADISLVEKYPSQNIDGFMAMAFNPQIINDVVKQLELGGMADAQLTKMMGSNYTLQDLLKAFKGDMAFIVSDFSMKPLTGAGGEVVTQIPSVKMLGNIVVGDKAQMNKLLDKAAELKMVDKTPGGYALSAGLKSSKVAASFDDKNILIASDDTLLNAYKSGTGKAVINKDVMSDLKGKVFAFYINFQALMNGLTETVKNDSSQAVALARAKETFKDLKMYINKPNGKFIEAHYELAFVNEKENSLTSLIKMAETLSKTINDKKMTMPPAMADSIPVSMR